jgi:hypothetical protein
MAQRYPECSVGQFHPYSPTLMQATGYSAKRPSKEHALMRILLVLSALLLTGAAAQASCRDEVGAAKARIYVQHCREVSPATRPPCNVDNACALILAEIRRGCAFLKGEAPTYCQEYTGRR